MADVYGLPDFRFLTIPHPIASLSPAQIEANVEPIGLNSKGNVFGSGFRANATIGRAIRLTAINAFGLRPHELDQATQGNPAKYTACIAENEEESPWPPFHVEHGFQAPESTVTAFTMRTVAHIE